MLIGELSKKTGFSKDTIRFYEKKGLINVSRKARRENNYKEYSQEILNRLLLIKRIKDFGFTLNETAEFLFLIENNKASCSRVSQKVNNKIQSIEKKIAELQQFKQTIIDKVNNNVDACNTDGVNCQLLLPD